MTEQEYTNVLDEPGIHLSELIRKLQAIHEEEGDLQVWGGSPDWITQVKFVPHGNDFGRHVELL